MSQIKIQTGKASILLVEVPEILKQIKVIKSHVCGLYNGGMLCRTWKSKKLPTGNYELLGLSTELTEGQCERVVEWNDEEQFYRLYPHVKWMGDISALQSFASILTSHNVDPSKCWAVILIK